MLHAVVAGCPQLLEGPDLVCLSTSLSNKLLQQGQKVRVTSNTLVLLLCVVDGRRQGDCCCQAVDTECLLRVWLLLSLLLLAEMPEVVLVGVVGCGPVGSCRRRLIAPTVCLCRKISARCGCGPACSCSSFAK